MFPFPLIRKRPSKSKMRRFFYFGLIAAIISLSAGCGSKGGSSNPNPPALNPVPAISSLNPSSISAGSRAMTLIVTGTNFVNGSVIRWEGIAQSTTFQSSTQLRTTINIAELASTGIKPVSVFTPAPGGGTSGTLTFSINSAAPLSFETVQLPDAFHSKPYSYSLKASGGIPPYSWTIQSSPSWLSLSSSGTISGTAPAGSSTSNLSVRVSDYAATPSTLSHAFSINVSAGSIGRNDSCENATAISAGTIRASISPYADTDVYWFQGTKDQIVLIETFSQSLNINSHLDTYLELLDSSCTDPIAANDDASADTLDSVILSNPLPSTGKYYIRVSDMRGDGRPDFIYDLRLSN
jgi:hypothetical protein